MATPSLFSRAGLALLFLASGCALQTPPNTLPAPLVYDTPAPPTPVKPTPAVTPVDSIVKPPQPPRVLSDAEGQQLVNRLLPARISDRKGWANDIFAAFSHLRVPYSAENFCAVMAVIEQESTWQSDPVVPGMGDIVWKEIEQRASRYYVPLLAVKTALLVPSSTGASYKARIDGLKTERQLNALYEEMTGAVPLIGQKLALKNPIRTGGPMQVSIAFAEEHVKEKPYPYSRRSNIRDEVFTRRGGVYFGTAILLDYPVNYSNMRYRFADFNAGRYSSRNAAFQQAVARLTGKSLALDGDLLRYSNGQASTDGSETWRALQGLSSKLGLSSAEIARDLRQEKQLSFEKTPLYQKVFALADKNHRADRETMPRIDLKSPKIVRKLTTQWFADRVNGRYQACLQRQ